MKKLSTPMRAGTSFVLALALSIMSIVGGCGGGVDSGGTGAPVVASGPISGFGSVIVNGVHFDERSASIVDGDGNAHTRDDLKLGMTTEINGSAVVVDASGVSSSTATSIAYSSALLGPISAIDTSGKTMVVLGQGVDVTANTVFDDALAGGLSALSVGDVVEVYALADFATGRYVATRIERRTSASVFVLRAVVGGLNAQARTFAAGTLTVSYAGLSPSQVPAGLANGQVVRIQLATAPVAGVWPIAQMRPALPQFGDKDETRLEGLVTSFTSSTQFSVDGVPVDASRAAFPDGTAGLAAGVRVRVEGVAMGTSVQAARVELRSDNELENEGFEIDGTITTFNAATQTFVVRGVTVDYSGSVDYRDGTAASLRVGANVEVRGTLTSGGTTLQASQIRFK